MNTATDHRPGPMLLAEALQEVGVNHAVSVPDWVQIPLYNALGDERYGIHLTPCCAEDEAVAVAAGLTMSGQVPVVLVQNQGFYAALNNIRAITLDSKIPMVFIVGQFGRERENIGEDARLSRRRIVNLLPRLLDVLEISYREVNTHDDVSAVSWAYGQRNAGNSAVVILGENIKWED